MMKTVLPMIAAALLFAGCGGSDDGSAKSGGDGEQGGKQAEAAPELVETGFGQNDEYVQGIAIVKIPKNAVDRFITVSMNFLDASGEILATEEQVESSTWADQELVLPVFTEVGEGKVASVEATVAASDYDAQIPEGLEPLEQVKARSIKEEYGAYKASFEITNQSEEPMKDTRIGAVCRDAANKIVGGGFAFPELIAAGGKAVADIDVTVSSKPESCIAYPNYGTL